MRFIFLFLSFAAWGSTRNPFPKGGGLDLGDCFRNLSAYGRYLGDPRTKIPKNQKKLEAFLAGEAPSLYFHSYEVLSWGVFNQGEQRRVYEMPGLEYVAKFYKGEADKVALGEFRIARTLLEDNYSEHFAKTYYDETTDGKLLELQKKYRPCNLECFDAFFLQLSLDPRVKVVPVKEYDVQLEFNVNGRYLVIDDIEPKNLGLGDDGRVYIIDLLIHGLHF